MDHSGESYFLGKNRIEALSDGIFAIAMTVLVLELKVPNLPANASNLEVWPALIKLWPVFFSYAASFAGLGAFWVAHHNMYHAIRHANRVLLCLNILFFMLVSFVPFATSVVNAFPQTQVAPEFFGGNLALIGWVLLAQWVYVGRRPELLAEHVTPEYRRLILNRFLWIPLILTFTALVCYWSIELSLTVYVLLLPFYLIPGRVERPAAVQHPAGATDNAAAP